MNFPTAVRSCLTSYATFSGRARRSEYWYFVLFSLLARGVAAVLDGLLGTSAANGNGLLTTLVGLALLVPGLAVFARRMHDIGKSGWWWLLVLTIVGAIVLIVWAARDGEPGSNSHGPSPKQQPYVAG